MLYLFTFAFIRGSTIFPKQKIPTLTKSGFLDS